MKIKWVGEDRMVPGYGMGTKGNVLEIPNNMAKSYIEQGLAEKISIGVSRTGSVKADKVTREDK